LNFLLGFTSTERKSLTKRRKNMIYDRAMKRYLVIWLVGIINKQVFKIKQNIIL